MIVHFLDWYSAIINNDVLSVCITFIPYSASFYSFFPFSSHGFTCILPPVTPMFCHHMQFVVFSNFVASFFTLSSHPLLSFVAGLLHQIVINSYVKTNLSNLFYNLLFLQNRNILTARTMYSVALLLQLVVHTHCCVAQYVTRSSTIWTA